MQVTGDKELVRALQALGRGLPNSAIDNSMKLASKPMLDEAVANARQHRQPGRRPKGGHLDEGIVFRRRQDSSRTSRRFIIGAVNRARYLAHLLEFGTKRHWQPNRFGGIMHPGARSFPFMRPAFDDNQDKIAANFAQNIWVHVQSLILKAKK